MMIKLATGSKITGPERDALAKAMIGWTWERTLRVELCESPTLAMVDEYLEPMLFGEWEYRGPEPDGREPLFRLSLET